MRNDVDTAWPFSIPNGARVEVRSDFVSVNLVGSDDDAPRVVAHERLAEQITVDVRAHGDVVVIEVARKTSVLAGWGFWEWGPHAEITIRLPRATRVHVHTDAARVRAEGFVGGELLLSTEAGVIAIADVDVRLRLRSAAGKITGERVAGSLDVETHAGAIQLDVVRLDDGQHRVRADVGAVRVELAPDVDVIVDAKTTMGAVKVDRVHDVKRDARARLTVTTEVGSIRVRQRRAGDERVHAERRGTRGRPVRRRHASFGVVTDLADAARDAIHEVAEEVLAATGASSVGGGSTSAGVRATGPVRMSDDEMRRVLEMVADGTLSPKEAQDLLRAMDMV